jgi:hypothetical protein
MTTNALLPCLAGLTLCFSLTVRAQSSQKPTQICAWIVETNHADNLHQLDLWLQSDHELEFQYIIGGEGIVNGSGKSHSPSSGSYVLNAGKAEKPWGFGSTVNAPAKIDITVEVRQKPVDIFSKVETPLLAKFLFRRDVPESEKSAPPIFAKKQCAPIKQ